METVPERRRRERGDRRRVPLNMRISPVMRAELDRRAQANARSLTAEAEILLEHALRAGEAVGTPWLRAMDVLAAFAQAERVTRLIDPARATPLDDPATYAVGMMHAIESLAAAAPPGADIAVVLGAALNEHIESQGGKQ
jgi:hypothetical protein